MTGSAGPGFGTFEVDRDGSWRHEGQEVSHPGVVRNLYANLRAGSEGYYLQVGPARVPVAVADAPYVVIRASVSAADPGGLWLHLSDGTEERVQAETLWLAASGTPYCRVKDGLFTARLSVAAWLQLAQHLTEDPETGRPILAVGDQRVLLPRQARPEEASGRRASEPRVTE